MKMRIERNSKKFSLKWGLVCIIIACWILPIALISGATGYYITHNINDQITETITTSANNSVKTAVNQIDSAISSSRYASYNPTIKDAYSSFNRTGDANELYDRITAFLSQQYKYDDKFLITALYFCKEPSNVYYTFNATYNATSAVQEYSNHAHQKVRELSETLGSDIGFMNADGRIYMVRNILDGDYKPYAVLTMQLDTASMFAGIKNIVWGKDTTIWLNDTPVVLNGEQLAPQRLGIVLKSDSQTFQSIGGRTYLYGMSRTGVYRISYVIAVDISPLAAELNRFKIILAWMGILIVPLLALVIWFFTRNVSRPIDRLIVEAGNIEEGNFGIQVSGDSRSIEFQYLTDAFNSMSSKLKYQFDRIYREELALRDARIMALQSQINPHFLNNTLEIINWEARLSDNVKVSRMIEALSTMLDAAIDRKGRPIVHVSQEMMYVDAYLYIISERLGKRLTVKKEIDSSLLDLYAPRLIMQPIIENAVEHGIQPQQKGVIVIRIFREGDNLILEVENDGAMTPEDERRIERLLSDEYDAANESANNLGIRNVNQRLKIIYGESSGLSIKMNSYGHTVSRIVIAINQSKQ